MPKHIGARTGTVRFNTTMELDKKARINYMSLKAVREKLNLTQDQVAEVLGTKRHRVSKMERGVEIPDWLFKAIALNRLLEKAGYSINDLILTLPDPDEPKALKVGEAPGQYK